MRYREANAGTSRETKFSGVHKDSWAARGLGARARVDAISNCAKKSGTPASETRAPRAIIKNKLKIKN